MHRNPKNFPTLAAFAFFALALSAQAQTTWTNAGASNWFTAGNWSAGVPTAGVDAEVDNGGTPTIGAAGAVANNVNLGITTAGTGNLIVQNAAGALTVTNQMDVGQNGTGTLTMHNAAKVSDVSGVIGDASGSNGTVTMNGTSSWTNSSDLAIGNSGTGSMTLAGSATVSNVVGRIGVQSGSTGSATVGGSAVWTNSSQLQVGAGGSGTLDVKNGGTVKNTDGFVASFSGSTGGVTVEGTGSTWQNSNTLQVGVSSTGTLDIKTGGAVSNTIGSIGVNSGSTGTVNVNGNSGGATWTNSSDLLVGDGGNGTLNIKNGGTVSNVNGFVGSQAGSVGKVTVDATGGTSMWTNSGDLTVGDAGDGTVNIQAAGVVSNVNGVIASQTGSTGKVTVDGAGSTWTNSGDLTVGDAGDGTLKITNGGVVSNTFGFVGNQNGSTSTVTVDGTGSTWTNSQMLHIGVDGNGTLNVQSGAAVTNSFGFIGENSDGVGVVNVKNSGSTWIMTQQLAVGDAGNGTMNISKGGAVTSLVSFVGNDTGSVGLVTVDGKNSSWSATETDIAVDGMGTMNITNGGTVNSTDATIGSTNSAVGLVTVDGAGSNWTISGLDFTVGQHGSGTLQITNGGLVSNDDGFIGEFSDSPLATASVDGMGSKWTNSGDFWAGYGGNATLSITGGGVVSNVNGTIAFASTSTATVTVDGTTGASTWTNTGTLVVGDAGNGTLNVLAGGTVTNTDGTIGNQSGSVGAANIDGAGSTWTNSGILRVGLDGNATLSITNGATVTVNGSFARIGEHATSTSSVTVDGAGSTWALAGDLDVARAGIGMLTIQNGGAVNMTGAGKRASIGVSSGSTGTATVDGTGSTWTVTGPLNVGESGNGTLLVENGGLVTNANGFIGKNSGSVGVATIDGGGSKWDLGNTSLTVGGDGNGTLNITAGGNVTDATAIMGDSATGNGTATVDGAGSTWTNSGDLIVAKDGSTALLTISNGGVVTNLTADVSLDPGSNGTAIVDGGGWTSSALYVGGGSGGAGGTGLVRIINGGVVNAPTMVVWDQGTLEVNSGYKINSSNLVFDGGTLRTLDDTNFSNSADLAAGGIIVDSNGFTSTLSGVFTGNGGLTKIGDGTIIISSDNFYVGDTNINAGTLQVDGSITSNTFVNPGGTLGGIGTVFGNVVNSGNVNPGDSPGTLTISGNYTQNSNGTLTIEIASAASHDLLQVGTAANLDGTLKIVKLDNFSVVAGEKIIVLTAGGGVSGQFATVMDDFSSGGTLLTPEVIYEADDVALFFAQGSFVFTGLTPNQHAVAVNLNHSIGDPRADDLINFLDTELITSLPHDYDLIAPEELAALYEISFSKAIVQNQNLQHRMDDIRAGASGFSASGLNMTTSGNALQDPGLTVAYTDGKVVLPVDNKDKNVMTPTPENRWGVFVSGYGDFVTVDGNDNAHGYDISTGSVLVGLDYKVCDHFAIGLDGSYSGGQANLVDDGRIDYDGGQLGAYATIYGFKSFLGNIIHFDLAVNGGWNNYDTVRTGLQNMAVRGSTDGSEFNAMLAYGGDWYFGRWLLGTWSTLQYTNVDVNSFTETGSLAPLHFPDQSEDSFRGSTGLRLAYNANWGHTIFRPEVRAAWAHEYGDTAYPIDARLASGAGGIFTVHGPNIGRDSALVDAGFSLIWNDRVSTYVFYDGNLGRSHYDNNAISGGLRISF